MSADICDGHMGGEVGGREGCLLSSRVKAQMLRNIQQGTGQLPQQIVELRMSLVLRVRSPGFEDI